MQFRFVSNQMNDRGIRDNSDIPQWLLLIRLKEILFVCEITIKSMTTNGQLLFHIDYSRLASTHQEGNAVNYLINRTIIITEIRNGLKRFFGEESDPNGREIR